MSWRRSKEEWDLLLNMHIGYFPVSEFQGFRRGPPPPGAPPPAPGTDTRDPADRVVEFLTKAYPLHTPEWSAWRAGMRTPRLAGRWLVAGTQLGQGRIYGEMVVEPGTNADEFTTRARLSYVKDGKTVTRTGRGLVYTGYAWRGTSQASDGQPAAREVMMVSRDQSAMEGRWFWGGYDEFGLDVTLRRAGNDPTVFGLDRAALKAGSSGERVRILGDNLPTDLKVEELDFGSGVTVKQIASQAANAITAVVDVAAGAISGKRDVAVRRSVATGAYAVYDKIDYLKVVPEAAMARLGGTSHPKGFQQFEARAYNRGRDNKPQTADDIDLGPVEVDWTVEEFFAVYGDDDKDFVGTLSPTGLFTPAAEGPNPKRKFGRNNYGDVWVVATINSGEKDKDGKALSGRAHLVVTVPLYVRWDQPEVAQ
jgi:quinohemoprotein amine dehydrogenase